jgi:hypothetical protein
MRVLRNWLVALSSKFFVVCAALALGAAALGVVPAHVASAAPGDPNILVVPNGGTVGSGNTVSGAVALDAVPTNGVTYSSVYFYLQPSSNSNCSGGGCILGNAVPTLYGWLFGFDSESVPNGTYILFIVAAGSPSGGNATSITVSNPPPTVVLPSNGATVSSLQGLDCVPPPGVNQVQFWLTGGTLTSPQLISNGVLTYYGWLGAWSTSGVAYGSYSLYCSGTYPQPNAGIGQGPGISVVVSPLGDLAGSLTGTLSVVFGGNGCSDVAGTFNATYQGSSAVGTVTLNMNGCIPVVSPPTPDPFGPGPFTLTTNVGTLSGMAAGPITDVVVSPGNVEPSTAALTLGATSGTGLFTGKTGILNLSLQWPQPGSLAFLGTIAPA